MASEDLAPGLRRIRAPNASPMTHTGTNSYLVGTGAVALIDPGPADPGHLAAILAALGPGERIGHILVTHAHRDHSALAPAAARATGAPVLGFGDALAGRAPHMQRLAAEGLIGGGEGVDAGFAPDRLLGDGEEVAGGDWRLTAIHTPGHFGNHLSFHWQDVVFSGDLAMGWASTLISPPDGDLGDFMASLTRLEALSPARLMPGHGEPVEDPRARLGWLRDHRLARSAALLAALGAGPARIPALTRRVYTDTPPALRPAAERNVLAHLIDLERQNRVAAAPEPGPAALWRRA
jgi:glyoxylase-like metal-dependent hydrolase (beta-lactamase superfamily II)